MPELEDFIRLEIINPGSSQQAIVILAMKINILKANHNIKKQPQKKHPEKIQDAFLF